MSDAPRGIHDLGGLPGGPVDRSEHQNDFWEQRIDALLYCLGRPRAGTGPVMRVDELRRAVESLGAEAYDKLSYYERWIQAISTILLERGVITVEELGRKLAEIDAREDD